MLFNSLLWTLQSTLIVTAIAGVPQVQGPVDVSAGDPRGSVLYDNFLAAQNVIHASIKAHGGRKWAEGDVNFKIEIEGHHFNQGHSARPWAHRDYVLKGNVAYSGELRAFKKTELYNFNRPLNGFTVLGPKAGLVLTAGSSEVEELADKELAARYCAELELLPQEYLRQALKSTEHLRLLPASGSNDVVIYRDLEGEERALLIDSKQHLLQRVEHIGHWKTKGDRLEWVNFSDYEEHGGVQIPREIHSHSEGFSTQSGSAMTLRVIDIGGPIGIEQFALPPSHKDAYPDFGHGKIEPEVHEVLPSHDLGEGVFIIDLADCDSRSMLLEFKDYSVIVEGGDNSQIADRVLDTAEQLCPGKPVRYLATSHHHPLYTGGIRSYVDRGVTILTTKGNVEYLHDLISRPYRIQPDAWQISKREPVIEVIDGLRVIEDETQRLELHEFDSSTHTDEYVLTYVPALKLGFLGDLLSSRKGEGASRAGGRTRAVYELIQDLGLDIQQFSQTWYLETGKMLFPFSEVEQAVLEANAAKDSKGQ